MREGFFKDLDVLDQDVHGMAELALRMLHDGIKSLRTLDNELAKGVVDQANSLAEMDEQLEIRILELLRLQNPVAKDLRRIATSLKLITYINRIGRYGYDIARVARDWPEGSSHLSQLVDLEVMAGKVEQMLLLVLQAHINGKAPDMQFIQTVESEVDDMRRGIWRQCLTFMAEKAQNIESCANYMMVARYLERAGDNVVKMAEKQYYCATGKRIVLD